MIKSPKKLSKNCSLHQQVPYRCRYHGHWLKQGRCHFDHQTAT